MNRFTTRIFSWVILTIAGMGMLNAQSVAEVERLIDQQEYEKAVAMTEKLLVAEPKNDKLYYLKGTAQFESGSNGDARASFTRGAGYNGRDPWNLIGLGSTWAKDGNFDEAKKHFDKALEINKANNVDILVGVADGYLVSEKKEFVGEAEKILYKVKALDSKNVKAYISLGDMYAKQGVEELAFTNYKEAVKLDPKFMKGYLRVGQSLAKQKNYQEAADYFMKAKEVDPNYAPVYKELGELWYKAGKYENAKENYRKYVEMTKNDCNARQRYASFLYLTKDYDASIAEMEAVLTQCQSASVIPYRILGYCYVEKKDGTKGQNYLAQYFAKVLPKDILFDDYDYMARAYELQGNDSLAINEYKKALAINPAKTEINSYIAGMYFKKKSYKESAQYYDVYLKSPNTAGMKEWFQWANSYYLGGDTVNADTAFGTLIVKYPGVHIGYLYKARIQAMKDPNSKLGLALANYQKVYDLLATKENAAAKEKKDLLESAQYLGFYYFSKGNDCKTSMPYWTRVIEMDPENKGAQDVIKFCKQ